MSFHKKFVLVESLALERAMQLKRKCDFAQEPYLAQSVLSQETGWAPTMATVNRPDDGCSMAELGLDGEVEAIREIPWSEPNAYPENQDYHILRLYRFSFNNPKTHKLAIDVVIWIGKKTKGSDWDVRCESVWMYDDKGHQAHDPLVSNRYDKALAV